MPDYALTATEIAELSDTLRSLLDRISTGEFSASTAMERRIEGAVVALDAVLGRDGLGILIAIDHLL